MRTSLVNEILSRHKQSDLVMLTGDLGFMAFEGLQAEMGDRFINAGVAEANMIGLAAGLSRLGFMPICYSIIPFLALRCLEQIRVQLCQHGNKALLTGIGAGYAYGSQGPSHHAMEDLAAMLALPGMTVVTPCSSRHIRATFDNLDSIDTPVYLRLGMTEEPPVSHSNKTTFQFGKIETFRQGTDAAIVVAGPIVERCLRVAGRLADHGLSVGVHALHCLKPLDTKGVLEAVNGVSAVFTVEQHCPHGGLGSLIAQTLARNGAMPQIFNDFSFSDKFMKRCGTMMELEEREGLDERQLATTIRQAMGEKL